MVQKPLKCLKDSKMFKGTPVIPKPMGAKNKYMPPTSRPKGVGRRKPHSGKFTRNSKESSNPAALMSGFNKINIFFNGMPLVENVKPAPVKNPFSNLMNHILGK